MELSVKFNGYELGEYIDVLQGFTALSGTDWTPDVTSIIGLKRGAEFNYTTHKSKMIPMPFCILEDMESKYDKLEHILNVDEPKPLIFENMPDRIFYAVPTGDLDFDEISILGVGTITWLIPDGLAHSTTEKEFMATINDDGIMETTIVNNGTESVPISYEITHNHENGYIGIVSEYGAMQFGQISERDEEVKQKYKRCFTKFDLGLVKEIIKPGIKLNKTKIKI